ncbi:hypothetical protein QBC47DRAFT_405505 [Echria macrotheca]|uniref:Uncharacterized protein n=1 Tax=Echria macrotheca TaxID=438768 RepID=A0AAJ0B7R2_9PEZI|nr:hypothetical protein QBC47DRAFT_405505 [Echria macrotheca]
MTDKHPQGGDLFDMAKDGTKVPADAAKPNIIPSVARPDQKTSETAAGLGASTLHQAADNPIGGTGLGGEVISAAGGELPEDIGGKYSRGGGKERGEKHSTPHGGRNQPSHG